jgi:hypothetical protein
MSILFRTNKAKRSSAAFAPKAQADEKVTTVLYSVEDQKRIVADVLNPPDPTPAYLHAKEAYSQLIKKAC